MNLTKTFFACVVLPLLLLSCKQGSGKEYIPFSEDQYRKAESDYGGHYSVGISVLFEDQTSGEDAEEKVENARYTIRIKASNGNTDIPVSYQDIPEEVLDMFEAEIRGDLSHGDHKPVRETWVFTLDPAILSEMIAKSYREGKKAHDVLLHTKNDGDWFVSGDSLGEINRVSEKEPEL